MLLIYTVFEIVRPKPLDWTATYSNKDKIPYGTFVLYDYMQDIFPGNKISTVRKPVYNEVMDLYAYRTDIQNKFNYIFINDAFSADTLDVHKMIDFVEAGNNVFIAVSFLENDSLENLFKIHYQYSGEYNVVDSVKTNFENKNLKSKKDYLLRSYNDRIKIGIGEKSKAEVLGRMDGGLADFVRVKYGEGYFYFNTHPLLFTNYYLLNDSTKDYACKALSYLPVREILWDEYQKQGSEGDQSIFSVLLNNQPLRWAYYVALISLILFILFEGKRKQRIIPVIEPLKNSTLEFTKTLGNLYLQKRNHKNIAEKKITYFFEFIRERFLIRTNEINDDLITAIANKSGIEKETIDAIFKQINFITYSESITEETLLIFNKMLEDFYEGVK